MFLEIDDFTFLNIFSVGRIVDLSDDNCGRWPLGRCFFLYADCRWWKVFWLCLSLRVCLCAEPGYGF